MSTSRPIENVRNRKEYGFRIFAGQHQMYGATQPGPVWPALHLPTHISLYLNFSLHKLKIR